MGSSHFESAVVWGSFFFVPVNSRTWEVGSIEVWLAIPISGQCASLVLQLGCFDALEFRLFLV